MTILFVCSGNTCRSPLAVAAWRALEREEGALAEIEVASAGTAAWKSGAATSHSQKIARQWNVDLSQHRARGLSQKLARGADLILTMTREQAQTVRDQFGLPSHRVRALGEFDRSDFRVLDNERVDATNVDAEASDEVAENEARNAAFSRTDDERLAALLEGASGKTQALENKKNADIADPFGGSLEAYESCGARIKNAVKNVRQKLREGTLVP